MKILDLPGFESTLFVIYLKGFNQAIRADFAPDFFSLSLQHRAKKERGKSISLFLQRVQFFW